MTVAQIRRMFGLVSGLDEDRKVNLTLWKNQRHVTLSFMNAEGVVWRYTIEPDGTYQGEESA